MALKGKLEWHAGGRFKFRLCLAVPEADPRITRRSRHVSDPAKPQSALLPKHITRVSGRVSETYTGHVIL